MEQILKILEAIESKVDETKAEVVKINVTLDNIKIERSKLQTVFDNQEKRIDKLERQLKRKNLILTGIKEDETKDKADIEQVILQIVNETLNVKCTLENIDDAFRLGTV